jgi:hypothetical protein
MNKRIAEVFENTKDVLMFAISMTRDVSRYMKEERENTDFTRVAELLDVRTMP